MTKEEIQKLEYFKLATPPSSYTESQAQDWLAGLNFGIDKIIEKLLKDTI